MPAGWQRARACAACTALPQRSNTAACSAAPRTLPPVLRMTTLGAAPGAGSGVTLSITSRAGVVPLQTGAGACVRRCRQCVSGQQCAQTAPAAPAASPTHARSDAPSSHWARRQRRRRRAGPGMRRKCRSVRERRGVRRMRARAAAAAAATARQLPAAAVCAGRGAGGGTGRPPLAWAVASGSWGWWSGAMAGSGAAASWRKRPAARA